MTAERWRTVAGFADHEVSDKGRVRTTAQATSRSSGWWWLPLLLAAVVAVREAQLVNSIATAVTLALCAIPAAWAVRQGVGEWKHRRLYDRPHQAHPVVRKALPRAPLAIEAGRPVVDVAVEQDAWRMS